MTNQPPIEIAYAPVIKGRISPLAIASLVFAIISFPAGASLSMFFEEGLHIHQSWTEWMGFSIFAGGVTLGLSAAIAALARGARRGRWIAITGLALCGCELLIALNLAHRVFHWL